MSYNGTHLSTGGGPVTTVRSGVTMCFILAIKVVLCVCVCQVVVLFSQGRNETSAAWIQIKQMSVV